MQNTLTGNPDIVDAHFFDAPPENPLDLLKEWVNTADVLKLSELRGLVLSTINVSNKPSSRVVLLKEVNENGVIFCSNESSQKIKDASGNPYVAGTLWWRETMQQINFSGYLEKLPADISDQLFSERTIEAQAVSVESSQSALMIDEDALKNSINLLIQKNKSIARPKTWNAYHIHIESIEFWLGNRTRLSRRLRYDLLSDGWLYKKLQP